MWLKNVKPQVWSTLLWFFILWVYCAVYMRRFNIIIIWGPHCYHHQPSFIFIVPFFHSGPTDWLSVYLSLSAALDVFFFFRIWNCCLLKLDGVIDTAYFLYKKLTRGYIREVCDEKQNSRLGGLQLWWVSKLMSPTTQSHGWRRNHWDRLKNCLNQLQYNIVYWVWDAFTNDWRSF